MESSTANSKGITIVEKVGDSITLEIRNLPKDFSYAYIFFRNIEQECLLLKIEIEKARNNGDKGKVAYLESALQFFKNHPVGKNFYVGGMRFDTVSDAIKILEFRGELLFTGSVALCVENRIDVEISVIEHEYELK